MISDVKIEYCVGASICGHALLIKGMANTVAEGERSAALWLSLSFVCTVVQGCQTVVYCMGMMCVADSAECRVAD